MLGYNVSVGGIGYGLNYSRTRETGKTGMTAEYS